MKRCILVLFFLITCTAAFSQGDIVGSVFKDENQDGIYDYEPPIDGVTIELYDSYGMLLDSVTTTSMDMPDQAYFSGIPYDMYTLKFTAPPDYMFSSGTDSSITYYEINNNGQPATATLYNAAPYESFELGLYHNPLQRDPTVQASNLEASNNRGVSVAFSWERGNGDGVIIIASEGKPVSERPVDGEFYSQFHGFGMGEDLGNGNFVVYRGTGTSMHVRDLKPQTTYYLAAFEFNGPVTSPKYLSYNPATITVTTNDFSSPVAGMAMDLGGHSCLVGLGSSDCYGGSLDTEGEFINNTGVFTLELWLKLNDHESESCQAIYTNGEGAEKKGVFFAYDNRTELGRNKQLVCELYNGSGTKIISSLSPENVIEDNGWHHVAFVGDGTNINFYVDGVQYQGTGTMTSLSTGMWTHNVGFLGVCPITGCRTGDISYKYWLDASVDEIRFWKDDRTNSEIKNNMNLVAVGTETDLHAYFQFNEGNENEVIIPDLLHHFSATDYGTPTYVVSGAPVAKGKSYSLPVSSAGTYEFHGTDLTMYFGRTGTYPDGEIVVSRLFDVPDTLPSDDGVYTSDYWVIRNYGSNDTFSALERLVFEDISSSVIEQGPVNIYKRPFGATGGKWENLGPASFVDELMKKAIFDAEGKITSFSQFVLGSGGGVVTNFLNADGSGKNYISKPYPQPSEGTDIHFTYHAPVTGDVRIVVLNVEGNQERVFYSGKVAVGENQFTIPHTFLNPGVNLLKVVSEAGIATEKLVVY